ncbi:hypothetical protein HAX54_042780 [Datura stramonium]|uniref:Uncharacterized protein n=1 Tax=Datura stramonium TaxID=4076 RepID=A0ABS8W2Z4_DATST|nr:hypothetical protein [Datura stramonium]
MACTSLHSILTYITLPFECAPEKLRFLGPLLRLPSILEIPFCQALIKLSIYGPSFWKTVHPFNRTLRTQFSGFLEVVAGMGRTVLQTDGPSVASSIEQFFGLNSFLFPMS